MYIITAPVPTKLATAIKPYRQRFDPLIEAIPTHILLLEPFRFPGSIEELYYCISEVGEIYAPIKVSLAGWDASEHLGYHLRLPLIAGRFEVTELHNELLARLLNQPPSPAEDYWPHIVFGRFATAFALEQAKKALKGFEPQFIFRISTLELLQRDTSRRFWEIQSIFNLEATLFSPSRKKK